jgi:zinc protease
MRRLTAWLTLVVIAGPFRLPAQRPSAAVRPISHSRFVLPNGLVVLLNEDHSSPVIGVEVLYHFGAKDERPSQLGFAHLCEHLMGTGSKNVGQETKLLIQSIGGVSAGTPAAWAATDEDRTHYFYTIPSNQLETSLWAESDRMAAPFSRVTMETFAGNRDVVRQERNQNRDNQAFGDADRFVLDAFFDGQERHVRDALTPMTQLDHASADDVLSFCKPYYVPNNAIVALSGDFDGATARRLVTRYFSDIRRGEVPAHPVAEPTRAKGERRLVLEDPRARVPALRMMWFTAGFSEPERLPLNLLAALLAPADPRLRQLLPGTDRAGRLSKALLYDRQLATSVSAGNIDMERGGIFQIVVTPRPDASLSAIESVVDSVLADIKTSRIDASELTPFKKFTETIGTSSLQTRAARADTLAQGEAYAKDPIAYAKQTARTLALTPAEVQAAARKYLTADRIVMSLVPAGKLDIVSKPGLPYINVTPAKTTSVP